MARPRKITKETVQKLEEGFLMGLSDREACIYADIAVSTLYDYCKKHKEFSERKELLKDNIKMKSKLNVAHGIKNGDINFQFKRSITLTPIDNHSVYVFLEINKPIDDGSFNMKTVMQKSYIINSEKLVAFMSGRF